MDTIGMDDSVPSDAREDPIAVVSLACDATSASFADQQSDLKGGQVQLPDDGAVLLVEDLHDFQAAVPADAVVVDDGQSRAPQSLSSPYQQYQSVVVQGYVTSSGEIVHVVQQDAAAVSSASHRSLSSQPQVQPYQPPPTMHPDLYRLIKTFPDFSTKTLHRIFLMCHCDLKRALDQALFARQFRQLDAAPSYAPVAPSSAALSGSFHAAQAAPYRPPARPAYMQQMGLDLGADPYVPRGARGPGAAAAHAGTSTPPSSTAAGTGASTPILMYQQADPRLTKGARAQAALHAASMAQQQPLPLMNAADVRCSAAVPVSLGDGLGGLGLLSDSGLDRLGPLQFGPDADELDPGAGGDTPQCCKPSNKVGAPPRTASELSASAPSC